MEIGLGGLLSFAKTAYTESLAEQRKVNTYVNAIAAIRLLFWGRIFVTVIQNLAVVFHERLKTHEGYQKVKV